MWKLTGEEEGSAGPSLRVSESARANPMITCETTLRSPLEERGTRLITTLCLS
jgi:hypothetical protein